MKDVKNNNGESETLELVNHKPGFDPDYLDSLIDKVKKRKGGWKQVKTPEKWLREFRGGYEV